MCFFQDNCVSLEKKTLFLKVLLDISRLLFLIFYISGTLANETTIDGHLEIRYGIRESQTEGQKRNSIKESIIQLNTETDFDKFVFNLSFDIKEDSVDRDSKKVNFRQLNIQFSPTDEIDIKAGRQILTWGTSELLFINDLFPKDFKSFFIGRNESYLKAPSDAIKISYFPKFANFNFVYIPKFNADRFVTGERMSFYDPVLQEFRTSVNPLIAKRKSRWFNDDELALRVTKNIKGLEAAFYYYRGYWKSPSSFDFDTEQWEFSGLEVTGASIRSTLLGGVFNTEIGRYKSDSLSKADPLSRNSEFRFLIGFEREVMDELTASVQYYVEKKLDYSDYLSSLSVNAFEQPKYRSLLSTRLTKLLYQQNLIISFVNIYSLTKKEGFFKLNAAYKFSDRLKSDIGWNRFFGSGNKGNYSGLKKNNNLYFGVSYTF